MNVTPYTTREKFIPKVSRTCPTDSDGTFMTLMGEIPTNQISKQCTQCGEKQPLTNFYKKPSAELKKSQRLNMDKTDPNNYRPHCITCHDEGNRK